MPIASPWYRFGVRRPKKTFEFVMPFNRSFAVGNPIAMGGAIGVENKIYLIVGIRHDIGGAFSTSTMEVVEPNWGWQMRYKFKRFLRTVRRTLARTWRQFWADRANG